jgi:succinate dehydrogenase hydrophobic anchor subunit
VEQLSRVGLGRNESHAWVVDALFALVLVMLDGFFVFSGFAFLGHGGIYESVQRIP